MEVAFTRRAKELLETMKKDHSDLALVLDDTTCCTVSNVFARTGRPPWTADEIQKDLVPVYIHPSLKRSLKAYRITIDALDYADDSLSLETDYGKRLVMIMSSGVQR